MINGKMIVGKTFEFEAAHYLPGEQYGECSTMHGHSYKLIIEIEDEVYPDGMVMNFKMLSAKVKSAIISKCDHAVLNEIIEIPTAENLVLWMKKQLPDLPIKSITLYETSTSYARLTY